MTTYLTITPQLQILLRPKSPIPFHLPLQFLLGRRRFNPLGHVAQYLSRAQHAICVEAIVAEFGISIRRLVEGYRKGEVPVG
jgi:hypothetical protein